MKALFLILTLLLAGSVAADDGPAWESLFDGKTLAGWTGPDGAAPGKGWRVQDGAIYLDGRGDMLLSAKEYGDFELEWEWKIAEGGNNGLKYWVTKVGGKEWLGIEYQMVDDLKNSDGKRGGSHNTASIYDIKAAAADKILLPVGQWNRSRVVVKAGKIQHYLNGKLAVEAEVTSPEWKDLLSKSKFRSKEGFAPGKGRVMLTDHGDKVWYRALRVRELPR